MNGLVVTALSAYVKVPRLDENGTQMMRPVGFNADGTAKVEPDTRLTLLHRGDPLPDNLLSGELDRLREQGAIGSSSQVAAITDGLLEGPTGDTTSAGAVEAADLGNLAEATDEQLAALYKGGKPKVKDLVEAVGDNAELAKRVLQAESEALKGDVRSTLQDQLEQVMSNGGAE